MWSNKFRTRHRHWYTKNRFTFVAVVILGCVILLFLLAFAVFGESQANETLQMVHIVFRHGEKNPTETYANDPYKDLKYWPEGWGELTNKGKLELYELGKSLRRHYNNFLSDRYSETEVKLKSSYAGRCQMSALTLLAGLFPPVGDQIWNPDLLWQPIPINPIPRDVDNLIASKVECPTFKEEKKKADSILSFELTEDQKLLFPYLTKHTGQNITTISHVETVYNALLIEKEHNLNLPEWTEKVFPEPMQTLAALNLASFTQTDLMKKLQSGPMIGEWAENMKRKKDRNTNVSKLYLYSGHDLTLVNLLRSLGRTKPIMPKYGASLVVELHFINDHYFVKLYYYDTNSFKDPETLMLPGCEALCSLDTFLVSVKYLIPVDWNEECRRNLNDSVLLL